MAPKATSDPAKKKPYGRMIQPALPNLPLRGVAKVNKTKSLAQQEVRDTSERSTTPDVAYRDEPSGTGTNHTLSSSLQSIASPVESFAREEDSVRSASVSVAPQGNSPAPEEPATDPSVSSEPSEKEATTAESEPLANAPAELTTKGTPTPLELAESESTTNISNKGQDQGQDVNAADPAPYYPSSEQPTAPVGQQVNLQALSGPGSAFLGTPPIDKSSADDMANGTQPFMPTENSSSPVSPSPPYNTHEPPQTSSSSSVFHEQSTNGMDLPLTASTSSRPTPVPRQFNALVPLLDHLISIASTKEGADWAIQLSPPSGQPIVTFSHAIILCRSLRVRKLLDHQKTTAYATNMLNLFPARHIVPHAFEAALRFLYSDTVLSDNFFSTVPPGPDHHATRLHNLDYIMSYWVSGIELGLEPVSACAERLLAGYLKWDIVEVTYKHALELGNSPISSLGKNMTGTDYLVASNSIIRQVLQYLVNNLDIDKFVLDVHSPSTIFPPRLPQLDDGRPRFNPALATMVFGSMPSSTSMSPSPRQAEAVVKTPTFTDTVASNILLNIDFENLSFFNDLLRTRNNPASNKVMAEIVAEREARRLKVLNTQSITNRERLAHSSSWEPVGLKESLQGNVLTRERVGFLLSSKQAL